MRQIKVMRLELSWNRCSMKRYQQRFLAQEAKNTYWIRKKNKNMKDFRDSQIAVKTPKMLITHCTVTVPENKYCVYPSP